MGFVVQSPNLHHLWAEIESRIRKLETATRFTFPAVSSDPTAPRIGDAWLNTTTNQAKIVDKNGTIRVLTWT